MKSNIHFSSGGAVADDCRPLCSAAGMRRRPADAGIGAAFEYLNGRHGDFCVGRILGRRIADAISLQCLRCPVGLELRQPIDKKGSQRLLRERPPRPCEIWVERSGGS